jgi:hypothetical protein
MTCRLVSKPGRRGPWTAAATACILAGSATLVVAATTPGGHPPPVPVTAGTIPATAPTAPTSAGTPAPHPAGMRRSVPLELAIPAIGLQVAVRPVQLTRDGSVPLPADPQRAGWVATSASPGENGTAVIAGHVDTHTGPAAFYGLGAARPGMTITVIRQDGTTARFTVAATAVYAKDHIPDATVYGPTTGPSLHLITCTGWDPRTRAYRDNLVVYATPAPPAAPGSPASDKAGQPAGPGRPE